MKRFLKLPGMPKIYEYLGFVFFFYSNEHLPVHCHVRKGEKEMKAELSYIEGVLVIVFKKVKGRVLFSSKELAIIKIFINKYHKQIVAKWTNFFVFGKKPTFAIIKAKK